jgi:hypothetical protein
MFEVEGDAMARNVPAALGMTWFYRQDYRRILEVMEDADKLPATYDNWLRKAEAAEREMKKRGHTVVRTMINPDEFVTWCRAQGLKTDAEARKQWANEAAYRQLRGSH